MSQQKQHGSFHPREVSNSFQIQFAKHVNDLLTEFEQLGNPFMPDESNELIQLGTKDVMGDDVIKAVKQSRTLVNQNVTSSGKEDL